MKWMWANRIRCVCSPNAGENARPSTAFLLGLLLSFASSAGAGDDPDKLVQQLGDPDFTLREAAHRKLADLGADARPSLEKALESKDVELRLRCESLLREVKRDELWVAPKLTFEPGERDVKKAFNELAKASGNPFNWGRSSNSFNGSVAFNAKPTAYWEALDDLCRQSNTAVQFYDDPQGLGATLVRGDAGEYPVSIHGPVRFRLLSIRRMLQREIHFGDAEPEVQDTWSIGLQMNWEQRAALCRYRGRPTILELRTDAGEDLKPLKPERMKDVMMPIVRRQREISFNLSHQPPTSPATKFTSMRFAIDLTLAGDFITLELPLAHVGRSVETDGYRLTIDSMRKEGPGTTMQVRVSRAETLDVANTPELVDERMALLSGGKPVEYNVLQTIGGRLQVRYTMVTAQPLAADANVQFRAPRLRAPRRVEFAFKDVPLP
jgi:hypothetical protein